MYCNQINPAAEIKKAGEGKTLWVIVITLAMMVAEVLYGVIYGSMGLLADGMHMGTHAFALAITYGAYLFARKQQGNRNFSFGTGKVSSLAGFTSALFLISTALVMFKEAIERFFNPVEIGFNESILVAVIGLIVNVVSMLLLGDNHGHDHHHDHGECHGHHHHDHNLKAAYLHVLADAVTSLTAIFALLAGKYFGLIWLDPIVAIVGGVLVFKWALGLLKESGKILLDYNGDSDMRKTILSDIESRGIEVSDLHIWPIDANQQGVILSLKGALEVSVQELHTHLREQYRLQHITIESSP